MGLGAADAAEAVAAVDGLAARRAEGHLGLAAAVRAGGREHLARAAVAVPTATVPTATTGGISTAGAVAAVRAAATLGIPGSLAAGTARGAAARLGEATLRV